MFKIKVVAWVIQINKYSYILSDKNYTILKRSHDKQFLQSSDIARNS